MMLNLLFTTTAHIGRIDLSKPVLRLVVGGGEVLIAVRENNFFFLPPSYSKKSGMSSDFALY